MPRTTSLQKAQEALADLGLVVSLQTIIDQRGDTLSHRLFVLNPAALLNLCKVKPTRLYDGNADRTVGMVLLFDQDGKFVAANYSQLHWNDWNDTPGYEVRTDTGNWRADETTLKAAVSYLQGVSPVGSAQAAAEAQTAQEAAEKVEKESADNLAALNQAILDNDDGRSWAGALAYEAAHTRRRLVADLQDLAKKATDAARKAEQGARPSSLWFHASDVLSIVENIAKLEALEVTLEGPFGDAVKAMAERYGY